ncbi:hypothetical protein PsYK624_128730 [Phanerochaete sordida]|uniref:Uncharacterized protein n=1 Tax=Phanerochaete sordida TaxID=48140 RepID=A0A9P3LIM3_9APHY|nr:hypothetical protein PsYK624_128730 [Phanerochaete sordida]
MAAELPILRDERHEVGQCALVCRYWARYSRAPLLRSLTLCSAADVQQLLQFAKINTLGRNVSDFVEIIHLSITLPTPPWVHHILNTAPRDLCAPKASREDRSTLQFVIDIASIEKYSPPALKQHTPRSFFHNLPRTLPVCVQDAASLKLDIIMHLRFAAYWDLICFVASWAPYRPRAAAMALHNVTWEGTSTTQPAEPPPPWVARRSSALCIASVEAFGCTALWPLVWLLITTRRPPPRVAASAPIYVRSEDAYHAVALVKTLFDDCRCTVCAAGERHWSLERSSDKAASDAQHLFLLVKREPCGHHLVFFILAATGDVTSIRLRLSEDDEWDCGSKRPASPEAFRFPWKAFDDNVGKFNADPTVQVVLPEELYESYEPFIRANMPSTQNAGRLTIDAWSKDVPPERLLQR